MAGGGRRRFGLSVLLLVAAITVLSPNPPAKAAFAGGTGTSGDPYQIADCTQLAEIDDTTANLSKDYVLTQNITCTGEFSPLKNGSTYFSGSLNGAGFSISGISITTCLTDCGIFARIRPTSPNTSTISNLTIEAPIVTATGAAADHVGALAGWGFSSKVNLSNVTVNNGTISGRNYVGGLVGRLYLGYFSQVSSSATVSGNSYVGGILGFSGDAALTCTSNAVGISNASNTGSISGYAGVGGILGYTILSSSDQTCGVFDATNSGSISSTASGCNAIGGVVGWLYKSVGSRLSNSGAVAPTHGCATVGGVIGRMFGTSILETSFNTGAVSSNGSGNNIAGVVGGCDSGGVIRRVYNTGSVSGTGGDQGGIAGYLFCNLSDSFSRSTINRASSRNGGAVGYGGNGTGTEIDRVYSVSAEYGLLGFRDLTDCAASFWQSGALTSSATCTGISSKTQSELKSQATFTNAGWDFVGESANGANDYWGIDPSINAGYPYLIGVGVLAITSDTTAPSAPGTPDLVAGSDSGQSSTDNVTNDNTPDISVTAAEAGGTVTVTATKGGSSNVTCTMTGSTSGGTCTLGTLAEGTWTVTAAHADSSSNTSAASASLSITIDTTAPTRSSFTPTSGATGVVITESPTITFNDTVIAGSGNITIYSDASCSTTFATIAGNNAQVTISGSTVTINPTSDFAIGTKYCITYAASAFSDTAGNQVTALSSTATFTFTTITDTTAPSAPGTPDLVTASDSGQSSTDNFTNDSTPDISVTAAEAGGTVTVTATKSGSSNVYCTMTGNTSGGTCTLGTLAEGTWTMTAAHADSSSNTSAASASLSITIDTTAPTTPSTPDLIASSDTGPSSTDNNTDDDTPTISVTAAEAGGTVTVTATKSGSSNVTCTMTGSTSGGTCTLGTLAVGTWAITATQTDPAGNTSTNSTTLSVTIASDLGAPSAPATPDLAAGSDTGSSSTDNTTNDSTPDISVTAAEAGGTVTVTATKTGSSNVTCTMTGSTSGGTCTLGTLASGDWSITAVHADAAGNNSSASSALTITIDTTSPTRSSFTPTSGATGVAVNASPTITFDENVTAGSGNITIYSDATCSTTFATIGGSNAQVTISGAVVTINPTTDFALSTVYCITYAAGTFTDIAGNQVTALTATSTITFTTSSTPSTTAAPAPPATTASTTTTTVPLTTRTLTITGAASRYVVTQDGPGLTAVPSAGGGAISWSSLTPSVCTVSTIAMMSILSAQSSVEVGRLNVVGTCTISATVAATTTHSSASTSVTFTVTRARPVVMVSVHDDHFYAKITLPREISSSTSLLRTMYDSLRFLVVSENCEIDIIATYSESESEFGSSWIGLHGRPVFTESGICNVRADLPSGDRWFATTSPLTAALARTTASATSTNPPTTLASSSTTVPSAATSLPKSTSTSEPEGSSPSITSFGPTSSLAAVSTLELDVEKQIVLESGETEIVFTRESLIETAQNVGVQVGAIRLRTASSTWVETSLPDATDVRLIIRRTDVELNVEVAPETGDVIRISVPIVVNVEQGFELRILIIAFLAGAVVMAWFLFMLKRRRQN